MHGVTSFSNDKDIISELTLSCLKTSLDVSLVVWCWWWFLYEDSTTQVSTTLGSFGAKTMCSFDVNS